MELQFITRFFWRWWWLIALPPLIVGVLIAPSLVMRAGSSGGFSTQFKYTAAQVEANVTPRNGDYQDVWLASELTVNAFTEWIRSSTFRQELTLILRAGVDLSKLSIATDNARSIGQVQMSYPDAGELQLIADAAITVLETRNQAYFPHLGSQAATVTIIDTPLVVPAPAPLTNRFEPLIRVGLALVAGFLVALLLEYLDTRVRYDDDIERYGVRILAKVPRR